MDNIGIAVMLVIVTGLLSQWLAWQVGIPAIIVLIVTGLLLGPVAGSWELGLNIDPDSNGFRHLVGLGVAVVLLKAAWCWNCVNSNGSAITSGDWCCWGRRWRGCSVRWPVITSVV